MLLGRNNSIPFYSCIVTTSSLLRVHGVRGDDGVGELVALALARKAMLIEVSGDSRTWGVTAPSVARALSSFADADGPTCRAVVRARFLFCFSLVQEVGLNLRLLTWCINILKVALLLQCVASLCSVK